MSGLRIPLLEVLLSAAAGLLVEGFVPVGGEVIVLG
jgi:hypothetical protein